MGKNTLLEVLNFDPNRILTLYTYHSKSAIIERCTLLGIPIKNVSKRSLLTLSGSDSNQGYVAEVIEPPKYTLKDVLDKPSERGMIVMCDTILDPHNFGAILRTSECFGVNAVIFSRNRSCPITPTVSKVSVGGSELVPLLSVSNLSEALRKCQDSGYQAIAAQLGGESLFSFTYPSKVVLILGSEGKGIRPLLLKKCDHSITIPMFGHITSLNVSQAAAVFLSFWRGTPLR